MKRTIRKLGTVAFWLGWPAYLLYFKLSNRTRILLTRGESVLVVGNWVSDGRWSMPGGGLHRGEDPVVGVLRELREEVGVTVPAERLQLLGLWPYRHRGHSYRYFQFWAAVPRQLTIRRQWHEIADAQWVDYRTLTARTATPDLMRAIQHWQAAQASADN